MDVLEPGLVQLCSGCSSEIPIFWRRFSTAFLVRSAIVIGQLLTASLAGYAFGRLEFPGREMLFWLIMATMMIPLQATIIPVFVLHQPYGTGQYAGVADLAFAAHGLWHFPACASISWACPRSLRRQR